MTTPIYRKVVVGVIGAACMIGATSGRSLAAGPEHRPLVKSQAAAKTHAPRIVDVKLDSRGSLGGYVTDAQGNAVAGSEVTIERYSASGRAIAAKATTDDVGRFQTGPLASGAYLASSAGGSAPVRVWKDEAAPPGATRGLLIVADSGLARGQSSTNRLYELIEEYPALSYGALGTAVVVPIVEIADDQDERRRGS